MTKIKIVIYKFSKIDKCKDISLYLCIYLFNIYMSKRIRIKDFEKDSKNFNLHTEQGMELLKKSVESIGVIESITVSEGTEVTKL